MNTAKLLRLEVPDVCERGAKDKLLWSIPEDAAFLCAWRDPVSGDSYTMTSDNITGIDIDHLAMLLFRRAAKERP